jgi:hypothetical protein
VDESLPEWKFTNFSQQFQVWVQGYSPPEHVKDAVRKWVDRLRDDPYLFARRVQGYPHDPNYWEARIPLSRDGQGNITICSYFIYETTRTVQCGIFGTLEEETLG